MIGRRVHHHKFGPRPWAYGFVQKAKSVSAPAAPTPTAVAASSTSISTTWSAVAGATSYNGYYRSPSGSGSYTKVTGVTSPWVLTGLIANTNYGIVVSAVNAGGETLSNEQSVTTTLSAPTGVSALADTSTSFIVVFTPPSGTITQYDVSTDGGSTWWSNVAVLATLGSQVTLHVTGTSASGGSTPLTASTQYTVQVRADSSAGNGDPGAAGTPTTLPWDPAVTGTGKSADFYSATRLRGNFYSDTGGSTMVYANNSTVKSFKDSSGNLYVAQGSSGFNLSNDGSNHWYVTPNAASVYWKITTVTWTGAITFGQMATWAAAGNKFAGQTNTSTGNSIIMKTDSSGNANMDVFATLTSTSGGSILSGTSYTIILCGTSGDTPEIINSVAGSANQASTTSTTATVNELLLCGNGISAAGTNYYGFCFDESKMSGANLTGLEAWLANQTTF